MQCGLANVNFVSIGEVKAITDDGRVCVCVCVCVCMYVCMYVCIYVYPHSPYSFSDFCKTR